MNTSSFNAFWIFAILLVLAVSGWYFASNKVQYQLDARELEITADNSISNLTLKRFDVSGKLINRMASTYVVHIPKGDIHHFTHPRILIAEENQAPWEIQSLIGTSFEGGEKIRLEQQVVMEQAVGDNGEKNRFLTESIDYYPEKKFAETQKPIHYEQPGSSIDAIGMRFWLEDKHVQLLNRARGAYAPAHS